MNILVFGTGVALQNLSISKKVNIAAFLDNNKSKIGTTINNVAVVHPKEVYRYSYDYILLASRGHYVMANQLKSYGVSDDVLIRVLTPEGIEQAENWGIIRVPLTIRLRKQTQHFLEILESVCIRLFKLLPIHENTILYSSNWGKRYSCNPRAIYEYLLSEKTGYRHVWAFKNMNKSKNVPVNSTDKTVFVKINSIRYLYYLCVSKYWVINVTYNSSVGVDKYKKSIRDNTILLQTWHAAGAFKKFGFDINIGAKLPYNYVLCSAEILRDLYAHAFITDKNRVMVTGLPRTDVLVKRNLHKDIRYQTCVKHGLAFNKKIMLYAPTYRDSLDFSLPFNLERLRGLLGGEWQILLRWHHAVTSREELKGYEGFVFDVSDEDEINPFLISSDALVTDYSSTIFEFALLGKPIIFYAYDLENYVDIRNFYFGYEGFVPGPIAKTQDEFYQLVSDIDAVHKKYGGQVEAFAKKFITPADGNACRRVAELLGL